MGGFRAGRGHEVHSKADTLDKPSFLDLVRDGLQHLYDPEHLRHSPLAAVFGVDNRYDTSSALRRILTEAIDALEPGADEPPQSRAWRMYNTLLYRYVEQLSQQEAAEQLAISARQLRRDQRAALEVLADLLWERFDLEQGEPAHPEAPPPGPGAVPAPAVNHELAWLRNASREAQTNLEEALPAVLDLARRLAERHCVRLAVDRAPGLPSVTVHPVALRQILISLLGVALPRAAGGEVRFAVRPLRWDVSFRIACPAYPSGPKPSLHDEAASLDMAQQLTQLSGGKLTLAVDAATFEAGLTFPALARLPVLAIDDNADTLQLLQRYVAGTRYRLIATQDPEQALALAEQCAPQIIVLDVMMPQVDGWEMLGRLSHHPLTAGIPIVVCTILAEKDLALFLGASAYLRKPLTQQAFLAALDRQLERLETGSR
jgi:CheY-like chemotaxis protein